jgi:hypothetical protein
MPLLALRKPSTTHMFSIIRPHTGRSTMDMPRSNLLKGYSPVTKEEMKKEW